MTHCDNGSEILQSHFNLIVENFYVMKIKF
jgi:hypothetical protein